MGFEGQRQAIESRFQANWQETDLEVVAYRNVAFTPPVDAEWVRLSVLTGESNQMSFGAGDKGLHRTAGVIVVECYTPRNIGSRRGYELADAAAAIFRSVSFSGITCRSPTVQEIEPKGDGYFQVNMSVAFFRDEVFA